MRRGLAARFEGIPDVDYGGDDHLVSGDRGLSEWTISGTTVEGELEMGCGLWTFGSRRHGHPEGLVLEDPRAVTAGVGLSEPSNCC